MINCGVRALRIVAVALIFSSTATFARIGETTLQFVARYGPPKDTPSSKSYDKNSPLVEGAIHHVYEYQGWKIRAAFLAQFLSREALLRRVRECPLALMYSGE